MATGSSEWDGSSSGFFINISELAEIMNTLERNGVDPEKWRQIGFSLGLYAHTLDQLKFYVQFLENLLGTSENSAGSIVEGRAPHYLWEVLSLWLRRVDRVDERGGATWALLNHSLTRVGDRAAVDRIQREKVAIFRREHDIDDRDLLEKALDNATITTKYTKLSISGLPGSGKSSFLKQLFDFDEPPHLESAITDLRLIRSSADATEASTKSWERVNYEMLKEMVAIKVSSNTQLISSSTEVSSIAPNKSGTISTSSVVLSPLERSVLESLQKELKKHYRSSDELQHQSVTEPIKERRREEEADHVLLSKKRLKKQAIMEMTSRKYSSKIKPDRHSRYQREEKLQAHLKRLQSFKEQEMLGKDSILRSIEEYLLHLLKTSHEPCVLDQCAFSPSLSLSPPPPLSIRSLSLPSPPQSIYSLSASSFPSSSKPAITTPSPSHCIALDDLLQALAKAPPSDSNPPHFISSVDTGCLHAVFCEMAAVILGYNSVSIVTQRLDEQLDRPVVSYRPDSYTHRQFLESSVRYASFVQRPHLEGLNNPSFSKPCHLVLGTRYNRMNKKEPLDAKNKSLNVTLSPFQESSLMKGSSLIFPVNTLARGEEERMLIQGIRQRVCSYYIQAEIPVRWYVFHLELIRQRQTTDILDMSVCVDIGASLKMNPSDVKNALMFYHGVTVLLYFPRILPDVVFLNPQMVLDKLTDLINISFDDELMYLEHKGIDIPTTALLQMQGVFHRDFLKQFQFTDQFTPNRFLHLLEKILLVVKSSSNPSLYFLPSVLPKGITRDFKQNFKERSVDPLVLKWDNHVAIPQAFFPALVVSLGSLGSFKVKPPAFDFGDFALVDFNDTLEIHYKADDPSKCAEVKEAIYYSIRQVIEAYNYDHQLATPKEHFFCSQHDTIDHLCAIDENKMLTCCDDGTPFPVVLHRQRPWFGKPRLSTGLPSVLPQHLLDEEPDHIDLVDQLSSIDCQWKELGIALGVETRHLESLSKDMQSNTVKLDSVMGFWRRKLDPPYTWGTILDIISGAVINNQNLRNGIEQFLGTEKVAVNEAPTQSNDVNPSTGATETDQQEKQEQEQQKTEELKQATSEQEITMEQKQSSHVTSQAVAVDKEASLKSTAAVLESMTILEQNKALLRDYTVDQIGDLLEKIGLGQYKETFKEMGVDGQTFFYLTDDYLKDLEEFNVTKRFHRDRVMRIVIGVTPVAKYI